MREHFDVIVVGGGPSGSSAARRCAQHGLNTLLLEKQPMPRRKVCGGAVSQQAQSYLDFSLPEGLIDWTCNGARVHYEGTTVECRRNERIAILSSRARFDHFLLQKAEQAGAQVRFEKVTNIQDHPERVEVTAGKKSYSASYVIVGAGASTKFDRLVRPPDGPHGRGVCLEAEIPVENPDRFAHLEGLIDIYFGGPKFGYAWVFHHGDHYSVGVGGLCAADWDPNRAMDDFMIARGFAPAHPSRRGHIIPRGGLPRTVSRGRLLLVGDSAGFVDPFYGEGIAYAIRSGQLAAEALARAHAKQSARVRHYDQACQREFAVNLRYSLYMSRAMYRFPGLFLRLLATDEAVLNRYLDVPLHKSTYRQFIQWMAPRMPWLLVKSAA